VILYLLVYVDDLILIGNSSSAIAAFITTLASHFSIKDLGSLHYFLGIEVAQTGTALHPSQPRYLQNLLDRVSMQTSKSCQTPMQAGLQPSKMDGTQLPDPHLYRSLVGAL
jgi:Reverse transcriptase (RNA-dependent DNA polymerase)